MNKKLVFGSMLAVLLVLSLAAIGCKTDSDDDLTLPAVIQNTTWISNTGHKLEFKKSTVIATPSGGTAKTYSLSVIIGPIQYSSNSTTAYTFTFNTEDIVALYGDSYLDVDIGCFSFPNITGDTSWTKQ